jgi:hypothetical protein
LIHPAGFCIQSTPRPSDTDLPFRTLGYLSDFEGGVQYKVFRRFTVGFSPVRDTEDL